MKASIIVPVYNGEKYIERCIRSILKQSYKNYELIVVDDGSTDLTYSICKNFISDNIKVFKTDNHGASEARNFGLKQCSQDSEIVCFVDSDDWVTPDYLEKLLSYFTTGKLIVCKFVDADSSENGNLSKAIESVKKYPASFCNEEVLNRLIHGLYNSLCNKCYDLNLIRRHILNIPSGYPEDLRFNLNYIHYCQEIVFIPDQLYRYEKRPNSVTDRPYEELYVNYLAIQENLYEQIPIKYHSYVDEFLYPQYFAITRKFLRSGDKETPKRYLRKKLIRRSILNHKPTCLGDAWLKWSLIFKMLRFNF